MKTLRFIIAFLICFVLFQTDGAAQYTEDQYDWEPYGDYYPTTPRPYGDVTGFFDLQGPGNRNPGNIHDCEQTSPSIRIPAELKRYIVRQFKYVWFNQDSLATPTGDAWGANMPGVE